MRKIEARLFLSLDDVVEAPDQGHLPCFDEETGAAVDAALGRADTLLLGRRSRGSFAGARPEREAAGGEAAGGEEAPFAKVRGDARRTVVSDSPLDSTRRDCEQLAGDLTAGVAALKEEPGAKTHLPRH
ncbi:hypothetical protein ACFWFZ_17880 [Streptomyces sp. NPDC060232]|uniref:hypothetical protein n=1 Tax=Streptomyces sp. NPDC060232 TaxID=3347079 RepID=UPI0036495213